MCIYSLVCIKLCVYSLLKNVFPLYKPCLTGKHFFSVCVNKIFDVIWNLILQDFSSLSLLIAGTVFVDGQEMKTKLPPIKKGTILTFQTETQPNGKVRVSVQVDDKEVTLDWKVPSCDCIGLGFMQPPSPSFYFALRFAQENWKIGVE